MILQRQKEGIFIAKQKGLYRGRKVGTQETKLNFIQKSRNQKILSYLEKEYPYSEISKIIGCSFSTINKVKNIKTELEYESN
jgi:DNA invertase Pin-like site-specific DNA recombinase